MYLSSQLDTSSYLPSMTSINSTFLRCSAQNTPHRTESTARHILLERLELHLFLKVIRNLLISQI